MHHECTHSSQHATGKTYQFLVHLATLNACRYLLHQGMTLSFGAVTHHRAKLFAEDCAMPFAMLLVNANFLFFGPFDLHLSVLLGHPHGQGETTTHHHDGLGVLGSASELDDFRGLTRLFDDHCQFRSRGVQHQAD